MNNRISDTGLSVEAEILGVVDACPNPRQLLGWVKTPARPGDWLHISVTAYLSDRLIGEGPLTQVRPDVLDLPEHCSGFDFLCDEDIPIGAIALEILRVEARIADGIAQPLEIWDELVATDLADALRSMTLGRVPASAALAALADSAKLPVEVREAVQQLRYRHLDLETRRIMSRFESLGGDRSLGDVQRAYGAEPLGLWRFSNVELDIVTDVLRDGLVGIGAPEFTRLKVRAPNEYYLEDIRYAMFLRCLTPGIEGVTGNVYAKECRKLAFLANDLKNKIMKGDKIFVVHAMPETIPDEYLQRLLAAVRRNGPGRLLYLEVASDPSKLGAFFVRDDGIMVGQVARLRYENELIKPTMEMMATWLRVCEQALLVASAAGSGNQEGIVQ